MTPTGMGYGRLDASGARRGQKPRGERWRRAFNSLRHEVPPISAGPSRR
jgi:hypothetical protein